MVSRQKFQKIMKKYSLGLWTVSKGLNSVNAMQQLMQKRCWWHRAFCVAFLSSCYQLICADLEEWRWGRCEVQTWLRWRMHRWEQRAWLQNFKQSHRMRPLLFNATVQWWSAQWRHRVQSNYHDNPDNNHCCVGSELEPLHHLIWHAEHWWSHDHEKNFNEAL